MRIISLTQPWASLYVAGAKGVETRSWATKYRGPVAVHATKVVNVDVCFRQPFAGALAALGFDAPEDLPTSAILGRVDLTGCLLMKGHHVEINGETEICIGCDKRLTPQELTFGLFQPGRFAWMSGRSRLVLKTPIPWRGAQGLRNLPDEIAARLLA